jgi:hypothetical protein
LQVFSEIKDTEDGMLGKPGMRVDGDGFKNAC